jgi:hypothetical protein
MAGSIPFLENEEAVMNDHIVRDLRIKGMTANARLVLSTLLDHTNGDRNGECWPSLNLLKQETDLGLKAIRNARNLLKQLKLLDYTLGYRTSKGNVPTHYRLKACTGSISTFCDDYQGDSSGSVALSPMSVRGRTPTTLDVTSTERAAPPKRSSKMTDMELLAMIDENNRKGGSL